MKFARIKTAGLETLMPVPLPVRTSIKARRPRRLVEAFDIAGALIGAAAVALASFVYWLCHDQLGASLILLGSAGMLMLILRMASQSRRER